MLRRKFEKNIEEFLTMEKSKILLVNGARQIGKSFLIRYVGKKLFKNYVEINLKEDSESVRIYEKHAMYAALSIEEMAGNIVEHGFTDNKNHSIDVRVVYTGEELILRIKDDCKMERCQNRSHNKR